MNNIFCVLVAWPRHVLFSRPERRPDRMHAGNECAVFTERVQHRLPHASHDSHVHRDVGRVAQLHSDMRNRRADRAHAERDDIHRAPAHAPGENSFERRLHFCRLDPVVGRPRIFLPAAADKCAILHPRDITRVGPCEIAIRALRGIELPECPSPHHQLAEAVVFLLRAVAPHDAVRLAQRGGLLHPLDEIVVVGDGWRGFGGCAHDLYAELAGFRILLKSAPIMRRDSLLAG